MIVAIGPDGTFFIYIGQAGDCDNRQRNHHVVLPPGYEWCDMRVIMTVPKRPTGVGVFSREVAVLVDLSEVTIFSNVGTYVVQHPHSPNHMSKTRLNVLDPHNGV